MSVTTWIKFSAITIEEILLKDKTWSWDFIIIIIIFFKYQIYLLSILCGGKRYVSHAFRFFTLFLMANSIAVCPSPRSLLFLAHNRATKDYILQLLFHLSGIMWPFFFPPRWAWTGVSSVASWLCFKTIFSLDIIYLFSLLGCIWLCWEQSQLLCV